MLRAFLMLINLYSQYGLIKIMPLIPTCLVEVMNDMLNMEVLIVQQLIKWLLHHGIDLLKTETASYQAVKLLIMHLRITLFNLGMKILKRAGAKNNNGKTKAWRQLPEI